MVNTYNFNNSYYYETLKKCLKPGMRVVVIPFAHEVKYFTQEKHFNNLYHPEYGRDFKILSSAFYDYGIEKEHIYVLNPHRDTSKYMKYKIENADVILFTDGDFIACLDYIKAMGLFNAIKEFKGITMVTSYNQLNIFPK
jgi:hypothetical protein